MNSFLESRIIQGLKLTTKLTSPVEQHTVSRTQAKQLQLSHTCKQNLRSVLICSQKLLQLTPIVPNGRLSCRGYFPSSFISCHRPSLGKVYCFNANFTQRAMPLLYSIVTYRKLIRRYQPGWHKDTIKMLWGGCTAPRRWKRKPNLFLNTRLTPDIEDKNLVALTRLHSGVCTESSSYAASMIPYI